MKWGCLKSAGKIRCYDASQICSLGTLPAERDAGNPLTTGIFIAADGVI